jgi:divalent metal cation (Fe/Co/Zn/Cd) transporter
VSLLLLAAYIAIESTQDLAYGHRPSASWIGIALAAVTAPTMPLLARAKRRVGHALGSSAAVSEAQQNQLCAYLSVALLTGLLLNAVSGLWWADPAAALVIAASLSRKVGTAGTETAATAVKAPPGALTNERKGPAAQGLLSSGGRI